MLILPGFALGELFVDGGVDDAAGTGAGEVVDGPFEHDACAVAEGDEVGDVDKGLDEPSK